ncbi:MAG TPA: hypothetical protein VG734_02395 [Lacunisphaera sp.]|nr:hypothetical protein [Lacunisphaera sp.]
MPKPPLPPAALKNLNDLSVSSTGKQIARDFGEQIADMKVYPAVRLSRLLEAAFLEGKRIGANEARTEMIDALKRLS